jgi:hypothetical protein
MALGIIRRLPAGVEAGSWRLRLLGHFSLSRRMFAKKSQKGPKKTCEIRQDLEVKAVLSVPTAELKVGKLTKTERKELVVTVVGPTTRTVALAGMLHLGLQFLRSDSPSAAEQVGGSGRGGQAATWRTTQTKTSQNAPGRVTAQCENPKQAKALRKRTAGS